MRYVARALDGSERREQAVALLEELARDGIDCNRPLDAIAAIALLRQLDEPFGAPLEALSDRYCNDSLELLEGTQPRYETTTAEAAVIDTGASDATLDDLVEDTLAICSQSLPPDETLECSPIPLLSDLDQATLREVARVLRLEHVGTGKTVPAPKGDAAAWWLLQGRVAVPEIEGLPDADVSRPGAILGFEGLLGDNAIAMVAKEPTELLALPRGELEHLGKNTVFKDALERAAARYHVHRAIARAPLFSAVPPAHHRRLLGRFVGRRFAPGRPLLRQGEQSPGVFLITRGDVDIQLANGADVLHLSTMGPGELVGVIGLHSNETVPFSAVAATDTQVLFLDAGDLERVLTEHPEAKQVLKKRTGTTLD